MKKEELLKPRMSQDEMTEFFEVNNPAYIPNKNNVGRYAKKIGYRKTKQMVNGADIYYFAKND